MVSGESVVARMAPGRYRSPSMRYDRAGVVLTVIGLAAYLTGLQKKVLEPILDWFADLPTGAELAVLVAIGVIVVGVSVLASRRRREALRVAVATVRSAPRS